MREGRATHTPEEASSLPTAAIQPLEGEVVRDLVRRPMRAHEEERALLARDLPDDLSQRLAVLAIEVGLAELEAGDGAQASRMRAIRESLALLNEDVRSLSHQLHSSILERDQERRLGAGDGRAVARPRLVLADEHRLVAEGLQTLLAPSFDLVRIVADGRALLQAAAELRPDVIVAEIGMPRLNGIEALAQLRRAGDRVPVVFLTVHREVGYARRALEAGAAGYVLKHAAPMELVTAIRAALGGRKYLTPALAGALLESSKEQPVGSADPSAVLTARQREILQLLAEGHSAKQIGSQLAISARTVEFHKYQMMEVLGLHSNADLIHFAIKHGFVEL